MICSLSSGSYFLVFDIVTSPYNLSISNYHWVLQLNYSRTLELFRETWDAKYPKIYKSWSGNWTMLSTYFKYPEAVRRLVYTTNAVEGFNLQLRKVTKSKTIFPSDDSLLKMLYLATMDITRKWTGRRQDWSKIQSQLEIYFEEWLGKYNY